MIQKLKVTAFNRMREHDWRNACAQARRELKEKYGEAKARAMAMVGHMPDLCSFIFLDENGEYPTEGVVYADFKNDKYRYVADESI